MTISAQVWCLALLLGLGGAGCGGDGRSPAAPSPAGLLQESAIYTATASAHTVTAGAPLSVSWSAPSTYADGQTDGRFDWVGLFKLDEPTTSHYWEEGTRGAASGTLTLSAPTRPGQSEFRYLRNGEDVARARSGTVTVTPE